MIIQWKVSIPTLAPELERRAYIYLPDGWEESGKRYDVMYMYDGHNVFFDNHATYGKCWGMKEYLDSTKKELIVVGIECNPIGDERLFEYCPFDCEIPGFLSIQGRGKAYMDWLVGTLKPYIDANYPTNPGREHTIVAGSSMGGLMATYTLAQYNHVFSRAAALSPSFWIDPVQVQKMIRTGDLGRNSRIYLDYGTEEIKGFEDKVHILADAVTALEDAGADVLFRWVEGGQHNEASWEKQIPVFMDYLDL